MLRCFHLTGRLAWSDVWIMGYGVDEKGEKMSKSKGNVIDPFPIIQRYGADTFRFWSASESNLGYDFRCSEQRIMTSKNFLSKLWNIGRFISSFNVTQSPKELNASDRWILVELSKLVDECKKGYDTYNFFIPANAIREFTRNIFASHYIEMIKSRVYNVSDEAGQQSAIFTLHRCLSTVLIMLAPICPFITEELWRSIYSSHSIHIEQIPRIEKSSDQEFIKYTQSITDFNSMVWNAKKETVSKESGKPLSLKDPIDLAIPIELELFKDDLQKMHNLKRST